MNSIIAPLVRTLAVEFYRLNSGFFFLIGTLTFGFMSKIEHIALAQVLTSSPYTLCIPAGVWLIYAAKIASFNGRQLNLDENLVLFNFELLPLSQKITSAALVFAIQFLPAVVYGVFLIAAGPPPSNENVFIIGAALAGCFAAGVAVLLRNFRLPFPEKKTSALQRFFDRRLHKPIAQFYIEGLMRMDPVTVTGTKIFTGALLFGVCALYRSEAYDERLIAMAITMCAMANLVLLLRIHEFEHTVIAWNKSLPIPIGKRYLTFLFVISVFLLPEWTVLFKYFPSQLSGYAFTTGAFYLLAAASFLLGLLQTKADVLEAFMKKSFWMFITLILLILFKTPVVLLALANLAAGYILFKRNYYLFEPYSNREGGA